MKMNKVIVKIYVPIIEEKYEVWLPANKKIYNIIILLTKVINEFTGGYYTPNSMPILYDKISAKPYDINLTIKESTIRNGTELILI